MNLISIGILLAVMGGVIAYFADRLGRTLGKKRLSLMGLRPRHTAEVLTVGAGALIPVLTILAIVSVNAEARKWIVEGSKVIAERDSLLAEVKSLDKETKQKADQLASVNVRFETSQKRLQELRRSLASVEARFKATSVQLNQLAGRYDRLTSSYKLVAQNLQAERDRLAALDRTYKGLQTTYAALQKERDAQFRENQKLLADNSVISLEVEKGKADSEAQKQEFERRQQDFDRVRQGFERDIQTAARELDRTQLLVERNHQMLTQDVQNSRLNRLMFQKDEEVARLSIDPGLSNVQARAALDDLLRTARMAATERGALPRTTGLPAAFLFAGTDSKGNPMTTEDQEAAIVDQITNLKEDLVLIAYSPINAFKGESVALGVTKYPNPMVFRNGQTIAEGRINGRLPEREIFKQVTEFLQTSVNDRAKEAKMIPNLNEPIIQFTLPEIFDLVKVIKQEDRTVRLYAKAAGDTRAAGPLKLQFNYQ